MKKFLAILLVALTMLSVTALAAETTYAEPFTFFDFGSESRLDDMWKMNLIGNYSANNCIVEENDDSWTITVTNIEDINASSWSDICKKNPYLGIYNIDQLTYASMAVNNGWGGYKPSGYKASTDEWNYGLNPQWVGKNQFMKIRIKNMSDTKLMTIFPASNQYGTTPMYSLVFDVSANDTEFQTYIVDMCKAEIRTFRKGDYNAYFTPHSIGGEWGCWTQASSNGMRFWFFGTYGETIKPEDCNWKDIKLGATVEVDYMIFAATAEMAAEYISVDEGYVAPETTTKETTTTTTVSEETTTTSEETTTTVSDETTTTVSDETTTTVSDETTTTVSDETTTTVSDETTTTVSDETTTTVSDETTTTVSDGTTTTASTPDSTTTTASSGDDSDNGGFPIWIIIVIVVVLGGGVAAFFVFKK